MATQAEVDAANRAVEEARTKAKNKREKDQKDARDKKTIADLKNTKDKINQAQIGPAKAELKVNEAQLASYNDAKVAYVNAHKNDPGFPNNPGDVTTLNALDSYIARYTQAVARNKKTISDAEAVLKKIDTQIASLSKDPGAKNPAKPTVTSTNTSAPVGQKIKFSDDYKYNAPMVSEAYFGDKSIENTVLDGKFVDQGSYTDARQAWRGVTGGRGTIQMDQWFLNTFTTNSFDKSKTKFDLQKYGFKFLYNPQTVSMAWGLMSSMDPFYEASQLDKFQVVATSLMSSVVSFELMLNRIKDFNFISETGLRKPAPGVFPYPQPVSDEDLAEIYNKGTMYDLEYLFKTINGPDGTFTSQLNGTTADRGWMRPTIVELHLGESLRYRVRISEFAVNHLIFNNRMVPILSTVKLTCSRFADGPGTYDVKSSSGASIGSSTTLPGGSTVGAFPRGIAGGR